MMNFIEKYEKQQDSKQSMLFERNSFVTSKAEHRDQSQLTDLHSIQGLLEQTSSIGSLKKSKKRNSLPPLRYLGTKAVVDGKPVNKKKSPANIHPFLDNYFLRP